MLPNEYKAQRLKLDLTQTELATKLGISRPTIARRESGTGKISFEAEIAINHIVELNKKVKK